MKKGAEVAALFITRRVNNKNVTKSIEQKYVNPSKIPREQLEDICTSLNKIANQLQTFIGNTFSGRFEELTNPLIPKLFELDERNFFAASKEVADELFLQGISWSHIVTFLVYNAELASKAIELSKRERNIEKGAKMVSQVVDCVCRYFDTCLMQWINQQEDGWMSVKKYEAATVNQNYYPFRDYANVLGIKQYLGVAAVAVVLGGLFLCSKLS